MKLVYEKVLQSVTNKGYWQLLYKFSKEKGGHRLQEVLEDHPEVINTVLLQDFGVEEILEINNDLMEKEKGVLNLPFPVCLFEDTEKVLFNMTGENGGGANHNGTPLPDAQALVVVEFSPGDYGFIIIMEDGRSTWSVDKNSWVYTTAFAVCEQICDFVNSKRTCFGTSNTRIKVKTSRGNHFIKKVVHCGSTKLRDGNSRTTVSMAVNWSHQWSVRGHWRRVPTVGKDREGNLTVKGFTWVVPHVKGPEASELISKVRIVADASKMNNMPLITGNISPGVEPLYCSTYERK